MNNGNVKREDFPKSTSGSSLQNGNPGVMEQAKQAASHVASEVGEQAKEKVNATFDSTKEKAAGSIGGVADVLRETGKSMREHELAMPVEYVERAADQIERIGSYLRDRTLGELIDDAESFARREPAIFFGGAFALGLIASRFLKSSAPKSDSSMSSMPSGSGGTGSMSSNRSMNMNRSSSNYSTSSSSSSAQRERPYGSSNTSDDRRPTLPNAKPLSSPMSSSPSSMGSSSNNPSQKPSYGSSAPSSTSSSSSTSSVSGTTKRLDHDVTSPGLGSKTPDKNDKPGGGVNGGMGGL